MLTGLFPAILELMIRARDGDRGEQIKGWFNCLCCSNYHFTFLSIISLLKKKRQHHMGWVVSLLGRSVLFPPLPLKQWSGAPEIHLWLQVGENNIPFSGWTSISLCPSEKWGKGGGRDVRPGVRLQWDSLFSPAGSVRFPWVKETQGKVLSPPTRTVGSRRDLSKGHISHLRKLTIGRLLWDPPRNSSYMYPGESLDAT